MSLPQFTVQQVSENTQTTLQSIVRVLNALIQNLSSIFSSLLKQVQLDSVLVQNVTVVAGDNVIPHTLGRTLTGWKVIRQNAASNFFDKQATTKYNTSNYLVLNSSAACTISLECF